MRWWSNKRVPRVGEQRHRAQRASKNLAKQGRQLSPVVIEGRKIAASFWGKAWCDNLESYRDYEYRLPRGRTYVRNGSVLDLKVSAGEITALVSGTEVYDVKIRIKALESARWDSLKSRCAGQVGSLIELLQGRLSEPVMRIITDPEKGLFPKPVEIQMSCSCPDVARMCKHVAAVMYGVGARLDQHPEVLFLLRHVDQGELIASAVDLETTRREPKRKTIATEELGEVFGIELAGETPAVPASARRAAPRKSGAGGSSRGRPRKASAKR